MASTLSQEQRQHMQQQQQQGGDAPKTAREVLAMLKDRLREKEEYARSIELEVHMLKDTIRATQEEKDKLSERIAADAKRIEELEAEAQRWKLEAFQEVGKATIMTSKEILATPECVNLSKGKEEAEFALAKEKLAKKKALKQLGQLREQLNAIQPELESVKEELNAKRVELDVVREERELARKEATEGHSEKEDLQRALQNLRAEVETMRDNEEDLKALRKENERLVKDLAQSKKRENELMKTKRNRSDSLDGIRDSAPQFTSWHGNEDDNGTAERDEESSDAPEGLLGPPDADQFRPRSISTMTGQRSEREILLQRDRSNLLERIAALQEELELSETEKDLVKKDKARLVEIVARLDEELSELRQERDDSRSSSSFERIDETIHGQFNLPLTETNCGSFLCANDKLLVGSLYVTEHYICWAPNALVRSKFNIFRSKEDKLASTVIELASVSSLHLRKLQRWSRNGRAIDISTADGKKITYRGFRNRDDAVKAILDQASALNHRIIVRNEDA